MIGKCSACKKQIMDLTKKGHKRFMKEYKDHIVELSNDTIMRVAVCDNCKAKLVAGDKAQDTADKIMDNHRKYWDGDKNAPKGYKDWVVVDPNTDEKKFKLKKLKK